MKTHLENAAYGMVDYLAYPLGMLAVAPIALRMLGVDRFGVWTVATAAISTGSIIASGFGDANIRSVAIREALGDRSALVNAVRSTLGIHLVLGAAMACVGWLLAPWMTARVITSHPELRLDCLWSLRLASLLMFLRAVETVCVSTQRAFTRYGAAIRVSLAGRLLSLLSACVLPFFVQAVAPTLIGTTIITGLGTLIQFSELKRLLGVTRLFPALEPAATRDILGFGFFTWIQSVAGVLFGQVDRLITGVAFGAAAVSSYGICAQLSQPIYGVAAAGLHFLFPYVTSREALHERPAIRRGIMIALAANVVFVTAGLVALLLFGNVILKFWGGVAIASAGRPLLPIIAWSSALSAISVTGCYAMLALGRVRTVTLLNVAGDLAMLCSARWLLPRFGIMGMGFARLLYGPIMLLVYVPLFFHLAHRGAPGIAQTSTPVCEEA
jgi:O-antigen/teichoic acid export membrane protein